MSKNHVSQREYERTHPWIKFSFDTNRLDWNIWLLLGEAKSKCEHIKGAPLLPENMARLMRVYLAKGVLATTAIEGNTLTEDQVVKRINGELHLPPSQEYLGKEIDNIVNAVNKIGKEVLHNKAKTISIEEIKAFNRLVLKDLELEDGIVPGQFRDYSVGVAGYRGAPPQDLDYLMDRFVHWLNYDMPSPKGLEMVFGILKAIIAHVYFVWIHPFGDGNGRTARLIEFKYLLSVGVPAAASHLLSNHYNNTRTAYYRQLDVSSKNGGDITEFINYALVGFIDGLVEQLAYIRDDQEYVHWINFIHNQFEDKKREEDKRRREVILEITKLQKPVLITEIRRVSGKIAEYYSGLSDNTVLRDVNILIKMDLLVKEKKTVRPNIDIIKAFISPAIS